MFGQMSAENFDVELRHTNSLRDLDAVELLWNALQEHHAQLTPSLGGRPPRELPEAWQVRRAKYERWLESPDTFFVIAESDRRPVGYAFVTAGPGYASWVTGERLAELETLSVLPEYRGGGVGSALLQAVWTRLAENRIEDLAITTAAANIDSHRFYEREGFTAGFIVYYAKREG
jgi:GNAT superfamily N-acetyltransferase